MSEFLLQTAHRLSEAGKFADAARLYQDILRAQPRDFTALLALGTLCYRSRRLEEAIPLLGRAVGINPQSADAQYVLGGVLLRLNRPAEALIRFENAIALKPDWIKAKLQRAVSLRKLKRYDDARAEFDVALGIDASSYEAWVNRGYLFQEMRRYAEALDDFNRAAAIRPDAAEVLINRGTTLLALKRCAEAAADYEKALIANPGLPYVRGNLAHLRLQCCDWSSLELDKAAIAAGIRKRERFIQPHLNLGITHSLAEQLQCARLSISNETPPSSDPLWRGERYAHDKIRLAYISADFRDHAVARLAAGLFESHDKTRFETVAFALTPEDPSEMRARIRRAFDIFIEADTLSDAAAAKLVRQNEIDIAIDLSGFTAGGRPGIFACRPAPVQVNFLGYPGTMGAGFYDYIVADRTLIPEEHRPYYSEQIVHLPDTYQCNDSKRPVPGTGPSRAEAGLPEQGFVFCCFNNNNKITPEFFDVWMRLLREIEGSVFWLFADNDDAERNLKHEAETRRVPAERLVFARRVPPAAHLARHRLADLFLDTLPYGAHTTASDALWMGIPVLTCLGDMFQGRVAASLNRAIGSPETITHSLAEYETLALALARDPSRLAALKSKLAANRVESALFDTARFTRNLEAAYMRMWEQTNRGERPQSFSVDERQITG